MMQYIAMTKNTFWNSS